MMAPVRASHLRLAACAALAAACAPLLLHAVGFMLAVRLDEVLARWQRWLILSDVALVTFALSWLLTARPAALRAQVGRVVLAAAGLYTVTAVVVGLSPSPFVEALKARGGAVCGGRVELPARRREALHLSGAPGTATVRAGGEARGVPVPGALVADETGFYVVERADGEVCVEARTLRR